MAGETASSPLPLGLAVTAAQEQFSKAFIYGHRIPCRVRSRGAAA